MAEKIRYGVPSGDWVRRAGKIEAECQSISAGGLAVRLGVHSPAKASEAREGKALEIGGTGAVFDKRFAELSRGVHEVED